PQGGPRHVGPATSRRAVSAKPSAVERNESETKRRPLLSVRQVRPPSAVVSSSPPRVAINPCVGLRKSIATPISLGAGLCCARFECELHPARRYAQARRTTAGFVPRT